jgi:hypothetical protein
VLARWLEGIFIDPFDVTGSSKIYCASHAARALKDWYRSAASVLFEGPIETSDEGVTDSLYR